MTKKNFGWVLYDTDKDVLGYCGNRHGSPYVNDVKDAYLYRSRKDARVIHIKGIDRILKVSLDADGRPVVVIGRG